MPQTRKESKGSIPLEELMVAMDAVDALRHQESVVDRELDSHERRKRFIERLKQIYAEQGIEVSDAILEEGVKALEEERFRFHPAPKGFKRWLAECYVKRSKWLMPVLVGLGIAVAGGAGYYALAVYPQKARAHRLPGTIHTLERQIETISRDPRANRQAKLLAADAEAALQQGDLQGAEAKKAVLQALLDRLQKHYTIRIVQGPKERSGIWRVPPHNPRGRNYYLIVEAVDEAGHVIPVWRRNEENNALEQVRRWGLRVDRATYERVKRDKRDDGIIEQRLVGVKERGKLRPEYRVPTSGGTITRW